MMTTVEWAHLCDYAFFDKGEKACLIGIFRVIWAHRTPAQHTRFTLAFEVAGKPGETTRLQLELVRPDRSDPLIDIESDAVTFNEAGRHIFTITLDNVLFPDFGPYEFRISADGVVSKVVPLDVNRRAARQESRP